MQKSYRRNKIAKMSKKDLVEIIENIINSDVNHNTKQMMKAQTMNILKNERLIFQSGIIKEKESRNNFFYIILILTIFAIVKFLSMYLILPAVLLSVCLIIIGKFLIESRINELKLSNKLKVVNTYLESLNHITIT